ncbi:TIGR02647 family protein, partial [Vibrio cholerae]
MKFTQQHIDELNLLLQFDLSSAATGIKVHHHASEAVQTAVVRLYNKGL